MSESSGPGHAAEYPADRALEHEHEHEHERVVVECAHVVAEVWTLLDGECPAENQRTLQDHLEQCPDCQGHYGIEQRLKALIARKCGSEALPEGLRERVRWEISQTTIIRRQS